MYSMLSVSMVCSSGRREGLSVCLQLMVLASPLAESCTWSEIANVAWAYWYASHGYCRTKSSETKTAICRLEKAQKATHRLHERF
jgi:hypothetical protein